MLGYICAIMFVWSLVWALILVGFVSWFSF